MTHRRELVLGPILLGERVLTEQIVRHIVRRPTEDLFAVVTREQPVLMIGRLTVEVGGRDQWLLEIDRIRDDHRVCKPIAVADKELDERRLIALGCAVSSIPALLQMRRPYL